MRFIRFNVYIQHKIADFASFFMDLKSLFKELQLNMNFQYNFKTQLHNI